MKCQYSLHHAEARSTFILNCCESLTSSNIHELSKLCETSTILRETLSPVGLPSSVFSLLYNMSPSTFRILKLGPEGICEIGFKYVNEQLHHHLYYFAGTCVFFIDSSVLQEYEVKMFSLLRFVICHYSRNCYRNWGGVGEFYVLYLISQCKIIYL